MKKYIKIFMLLILLGISLNLVSCKSKEEKLDEKIQQLENRVDELNLECSKLEDERKKLEQQVIEGKIETGTAKYILTIRIKQKHFSLDIDQHIKDKMNEITIQIAVDKDYYDSVSIGSTIADNFRIGSFICSSSIGNWDVTIIDKQIK